MTVTIRVDTEADGADEGWIRVSSGSGFGGEVVLRPITPDDAPFLRDLYASTRADELQVTPWTEVERRAFCDSQFALQDTYYRQTYPHARFDVVESAGSPVGRFLVATGPDAVEVLDIALTPAARGRGLGTMLLRWQQSRSAAFGRTMILMVEPGSPAERLYRRLGFHLRTDGELHRELIWRAEAVGEAALARFLDLAMDDADLRADLAAAGTDEELADRAIALGLAGGLAFGPDEVGDALRACRRAWFERAVR
ncbi:MAG: N-acetyltransferase family protein [Acidimicrobiales bacterium]